MTLPLPIHVMLDTGCVSTHSKTASSLSRALTSSIFTTNSTLDTLRTKTRPLNAGSHHRLTGHDMYSTRPVTFFNRTFQNEKLMSDVINVLGPTFTLWKEASAAAVAAVTIVATVAVVATVAAVHRRRLRVNRARPSSVWLGPPSIDLVEFCRFVFIIGNKAVLLCS